MIRSLIYEGKGTPQLDSGLTEVAQALLEPDKLTWVSLEAPSAEELLSVLRDVFHFHPLTIEDCQTTNYQPPKVDDFGSYLFIIMHGVHPEALRKMMTDPDGDGADTSELDCYLGRNYVVTSFHSQMPAVEAVWRRVARDERMLAKGADFLCHAILDYLVDDYMPFLDRMDEELDRLEDEVLAQPGPAVLQRIMALKHHVLSLRRVIAPQREVLNRLSRDDLLVIDPANRIYFRDIYDHTVRIRDLSEDLRDVITGTLDTYLSVTSNRLNEVMKALTIVSTIFLPLTFIAGIYGMNFRFMPELGWRYGYPMVWLICAVIVGLMLWFFHRRDWI